MNRTKKQIEMHNAFKAFMDSMSIIYKWPKEVYDRRMAKIDNGWEHFKGTNACWYNDEFDSLGQATEELDDFVNYILRATCYATTNPALERDILIKAEELREMVEELQDKGTTNCSVNSIGSLKIGDRVSFDDRVFTIDEIIMGDGVPYVHGTTLSGIRVQCLAKAVVKV